MTHRPLNDEQWQALGGHHTAHEIAQQPAVWRQLAQQVRDLPPAWRNGLRAQLADARAEVILTGAGTSSYIGELAADTLDAGCAARVRAIATTSLLSHPGLYLHADRPLLLVSFARSGNSPESQAVVDVVRARAPGARFLNITCNPQGRLAQLATDRNDTINFLLPPASCDQGFAMTSSFSTMLLAVLALLGPEPLPQAAARIDQVAELGAGWLARHGAGWDGWEGAYGRIVYLGGGPLEALAREAALKVLELSAGRITALAHTPLGFRHGPKSALNGESLVVVFLSQDAHARLYDEDLVSELRRDGVAGAVLALSGGALGAPATLPDAWLAPVHVMFAQCLSLYQSVRLGLTPDNPFPDGTVNRVVQGVTIHAHA